MQLLICSQVDDALFYWFHRGLHHPSVYRHIHKQVLLLLLRVRLCVFSFLVLADPLVLVWGWLVVTTLQHHTFKHTVGLATEYAHPVEGVLNAIATMAGPVLLGGHMALCMLYAALKLWQSIDAHSGEPMQVIRHTHQP